MTVPAREPWLAPVELHAWPGGHTSHAVLPASLNVPAAHLVLPPSGEVVLGHAWPAGHTAHAVELATAYVPW